MRRAAVATAAVVVGLWGIGNGVLDIGDQASTAKIAAERALAGLDAVDRTVGESRRKIGIDRIDTQIYGSLELPSRTIDKSLTRIPTDPVAACRTDLGGVREDLAACRTEAKSLRDASNRATELALRTVEAIAAKTKEASREATAPPKPSLADRVESIWLPLVKALGGLLTALAGVIWALRGIRPETKSPPE